MLRLAGSGTSSPLLDDVFDAHAPSLPENSVSLYPLPTGFIWYTSDLFLSLSSKTSESLSSAGLFGGAMSWVELQWRLGLGLLWKCSWHFEQSSSWPIRKLDLWMGWEKNGLLSWADPKCLNNFEFGTTDIFPLNFPVLLTTGDPGFLL